MRRLAMAAVVIAGIWMTASAARAGNATHWFGAGGHYWTTVDEVDLENIDRDGVGWFVTYQYRGGSLVALEADVEVLPDHFAGAEKDVYAPQVYLLLGSTLYAGVGIGGYYSDGDFAKDPFYAFKAGLNLELLPSIALDVSGNYRFTEWDDTVTDNLDSDTVTLAAAIRIGL